MTKTHLYALTQKPHLKNGMVEISVRHPLSSIIKIATKSSCPEMISFTYGEKIIKSSSSVKNDEASSESTNNGATSVENTSDYNIHGKDWFFVPDYAGEAASAVKMQILQIVELVSQ